MFKTILVGTDGSGTATGAVAHAVDLAKVTGADLLVLSAYESPKEDNPVFGSAPMYPTVDIAKGLLEDVEKRYASEVRLRTIMREGNPADAIVDAAEEERADVIVVGNKGMTGAKRFVLGSVPNAVSHHAPCHVLIVHTTD